MTARFLVNLRASTMTAEFQAALGSPGYLVAPAYLTRATAEFARALPRRRTVLVDNGRYDDVGRVAARLEPDARRLLADVVPPGTRLSSMTHSSLDPSARSAISAMVESVSAAARLESHPMPIADQLALRPAAVIGEEDVLGAILLRLGLDVDLIARGRDLLRRRNRAVARAASRAAIAGGVRVHAVASAHDYDTAFDAGSEFAAAGIQHAAIGFGAYMADDSYASDFKAHGRRIPLPRLAPRRYLRTALVARGFWDGWKTQDGGAPLTFHFLGLGAPIMLGIVALAAHETSLLTFDATSPIRDAVEGTLYQEDPAPLKVRTRRIAQRLVDDPHYRWRCDCAFCAAFLREHPFDRDAASAWRSTAPDRAITAEDLRGDAPLALALPLLAEPRGGAARRAVDAARSGHNHAVLDHLARAVSRRPRRDRLAAYVDARISAYERAANAETYASAVRTAFTIVRDGV